MTRLFRLDPSSGVPFYRQIIEQVLLAVADGRLKPGAQLPTVRQLAVDLSVNLNTVAKAYRAVEIGGKRGNARAERGRQEVRQMVPIVIPQRKREKPGTEPEADKPQHRRERG